MSLVSAFGRQRQAGLQGEFQDRFLNYRETLSWIKTKTKQNTTTTKKKDKKAKKLKKLTKDLLGPNYYYIYIIIFIFTITI